MNKELPPLNFYGAKERNCGTKDLGRSIGLSHLLPVGPQHEDLGTEADDGDVDPELPAPLEGREDVARVPRHTPIDSKNDSTSPIK